MTESKTKDSTHPPSLEVLSEVIAALKTASTTRLRPDNSPYSSLLLKDELHVSHAFGLSQRKIQIIALQNNIIPERYARNQKSITNEDQIRLLEHRVAIIGLGGLGGAVTEILARIGVGSLTLVDGDHFEESNLNRQLLSSIDMLGEKKADVAADRVAMINPAVETRNKSVFFTKENSDDILTGVDLCVDCLDTISARFLLENGCKRANIPLVSAAIGGTSGQAMVIFPGDQGLRNIYGNPDEAPRKGAEAVLGTLPFTAIAMAAVQCAEIVTLLAGRQARLRNKLLIADFNYYSMETMEFR